MSDYKEYLDRRSQGPSYIPSLDLPSIVMPDNGNAMDAEYMKELGYKFRRESQHPDRDKPTAWWWASERLYEQVEPAILGKGFVFTSDIQTL